MDLELELYSKILRNDALHYAYFDDIDIHAEDISFSMIEHAQNRYSEIIASKIVAKDDTILDIGCGMGALSKLLLSRNLKVEALTPDKNQRDYIAQKFPQLTVHHSKFENLKTEKEFGTIINAESFQYINLDNAFGMADRILLPRGRWIIFDYFRIKSGGRNKSGHLLEDFIRKAVQHKWDIIEEIDATLNVLPTLQYVNMYAERIAKPLLHYGTQKLKHRQAWLYYMTEDLRKNLDKKIEKEASGINPAIFLNEKRYMLFVLQKTLDR